MSRCPQVSPWSKGSTLARCFSASAGEGMYEGTWEMLGAILRGIGLFRCKPHPSATIRVTFWRSSRLSVSPTTVSVLLATGVLTSGQFRPGGPQVLPNQGVYSSSRPSQYATFMVRMPPPLFTEPSAAQALGLSSSLQLSTEAPRNYLFSFWPRLQTTSKNRGKMCGFSKSVPRTANTWQ